MRKLNRLSLIRDFNLFPETDKLLTLERKYGDSLNYEDLNGEAKKKKKKVDLDESRTNLETTNDAAKTTETLKTLGEVKKEETVVNIRTRRDDKRKADTDA